MDWFISIGIGITAVSLVLLVNWRDDKKNPPPR